MAMDNIYGTDSMKASKEAAQRFEAQAEAAKKKQELIDNHKAKPEEWIWVEGYKGTDKDMTCRRYQYEFGKVHYMPTDKEIKECDSGFHLCANIKDVFTYYKVGEGHRFFKVKALVKKKDYDEYGKAVMHTGLFGLSIPGTRDKLVASAIEFISELDASEVLTALGANTYGWTDEDKNDALATSIGEVMDKIKVRQLTALGYTSLLAEYLVDASLYEKAVAIGSQPDVSMDVKVMFIMRGK